MLQQTSDVETVLRTFAAHPSAGLTMRNFCRYRDKDGNAAIILVDDPRRPTLFVAHRGTNTLIHALDADGYRLAAESLASGAIEQDAGWPDPQLQAEWEENKEQSLFLNTCPVPAFQALLASGFSSTREEGNEDIGAHVFCWEGPPRFSAHIKHSCRLGRGRELFDELRRGVHYDPEGYYVAMCLDQGPSFVVEDNGRPVSWSCTHLNGSMGMIFTPEDHRRKGYGTSLSAYQLDHMLRRDAAAVAHVVETNTASLKMLGAFEPLILDYKVTWRGVRWPT